jgi:4-hydroxy-tetrahydrodipicolinate synthase
MAILSGCYTALVTPMSQKGLVDYDGLRRLANFQIREGVKGILAVGTTGESPTLNWDEHNKVIEEVYDAVGTKGLTIAGTGSNSTRETMKGTEHAAQIGVKCVLLVDPYYNGPSSLEIRKEYVEPVAKNFPEVQVMPYVIPGRTGTQLLPQDLAILHEQYPNISSVKEATGDLDNMRLTRKLCGLNFTILSGDDDKTFDMMTAPDIAASGVVSVVSNIVPRTVQSLTQALLDKEIEEARRLYAVLKPFFSMVTVKTQESSRFGSMTCKARNPLAFKTLMNILGMPSGPCRQPLGKMTPAGLQVVLSNARMVYETNPEILKPIEDFFSVDLSARLYNERFWEGLAYA